jgi:hypothetical protein
MTFLAHDDQVAFETGAAGGLGRAMSGQRRPHDHQATHRSSLETGGAIVKWKDEWQDMIANAKLKSVLKPERFCCSCQVPSATNISSMLAVPELSSGWSLQL